MKDETTKSPGIRTIGLTRKFGDVTAIDGLDLEIKRGELYGLVGPDGAGKTTIMRLFAAILEPTRGEVFVCGLSTTTDGERIKELIGYMPQKFGCYEDLTVMENINFYADVYDVPPKDLSGRVEKLLAFSNLTPFKSRLAGKLSGGMKQKLGLACALIHEPNVLFLDEPTNGVDPVSRRDFWKLLYDLWKGGMTIVFSTSYLDEAERCTRVALLHKGRLLLEGTPAEIRATVSGYMVEFGVNDTIGARNAVKGMAEVSGLTSYGDKLHVSAADKLAAERVVGRLGAMGFAVTGVREIKPSIEDVFIASVGE
ncbi:MAG: ABC transporter ATP-binding protein [Nitrospirae bacterium]|nr:ABC transporter ATP-binding protein [Nitrospirota bacterium]